MIDRIRFVQTLKEYDIEITENIEDGKNSQNICLSWMKRLKGLRFSKSFFLYIVDKLCKSTEYGGFFIFLLEFFSSSIIICMID